MEAVVSPHVVSDILQKFDELTKFPEIFIEQHKDTFEKFKKLTKTLYDLAVSANNSNGLTAKSLPKLLIDGFDEEQIWQQIELQNKFALPYLTHELSTMKPENISFTVKKKDIKKVPVCSEVSNFNDSSSAEEEEYVFDDDSDSLDEQPKVASKKIPTPSEEQPKGASKNVLTPSKKSKFGSIVDDQFFKLSKLEKFLRIEDLKEEKGVSEKSDEDEFDLFLDIPSDDEDAEDESDQDENIIKSSKDLMYEDFFDAPQSGDESINSDENEKSESTDSENDSDVDIDDLEDESDAHPEKSIQNTEEKQPNQKSAFDLEQEKVKMKIREYEKGLLQPLPWQLTGEVVANSRPVNSLIHQETDFDSNVKQACIVDSILNEKVENIVIMAFRNKTFCDVERKHKPVDVVHKKKVDVDQTKSQKSLATIYEEDYLKKQSKQEEEEDPKHKEIKKLMDSLFPALHALFSHIPKPAIPELKIVTNLPAITVEEVAPTNVSDYALLAPEEVKEKSGVVKSETERTVTDRKRERRKKKLHQKRIESEKLKKMELKNMKNPSAKPTEFEKRQTLKKLKENKNTKIMNVDEGRKVKSSKDFFSRLQDTVNSKTKMENKPAPLKKRKKN